MDGIKQRCKYIIPEWIENQYYDKKLKRHILKKQIQSKMDIVNTKSDHIKQQIEILKRYSNKKYSNTLSKIESTEEIFDIENQSISNLNINEIEKKTKKKKNFLTI
jgi:carbonic anhydrase